MENKKVLIILNDLGGGGAERVFVNIANNFVSAGIETEMLVGTKEGVYLEILNPKISVHDLSATNFLQYKKKLPAFLKNKTYTHIFTTRDYTSAATIMAKRKLKLQVSVIATLHYNLYNSLKTLSRSYGILLKYLNKGYIAKANRIVAVSNGVAEGFRKVVGAENCRHLQVIYNPVFDDDIYEKARESVREGFFLNGRTTLISVGRIDENKNHSLLIDAFVLASQKNSNLQLLILGTGSYEGEIRKKISSLHLQDKVHLLGFQQNPFAYMAKSDLLVLSSLSEGLPTVLIEALALGVNVVSTDCPSGPDEILEQGKYGWLAGNNNADSLSACILIALSNKYSADFLQKRALQFHTISIMPEYLNLLN